jgi:hypothetical protein
LEANPRYDTFDTWWSRSQEALAHLFAGGLDRYLEIFADLSTQPGTAQVMGQGGLLVGLPLAGRDDEARAIAENTLAVARAHANPYCIANALYGSGRAFAQADPARALHFLRDGLVYAQEYRLLMLEAAMAEEAAGLEAVYGDLGQALALFDASLAIVHRAGNAGSMSTTLAYLAVCFDRFDRPDIASTLYGASTNQAIVQYVVDLPALVNHLRAALGDTVFDQCSATGVAMDLGEAVEYARHHIELARRQTANLHSGGT